MYVYDEHEAIDEVTAEGYAQNPPQKPKPRAVPPQPFRGQVTGPLTKQGGARSFQDRFEEIGDLTRCKKQSK